MVCEPGGEGQKKKQTTGNPHLCSLPMKVTSQSTQHKRETVKADNACLTKWSQRHLELSKQLEFERSPGKTEEVLERQNRRRSSSKYAQNTIQILQQFTTVQKQMGFRNQEEARNSRLKRQASRRLPVRTLTNQWALINTAGFGQPLTFPQNPLKGPQKQGPHLRTKLSPVRLRNRSKPILKLNLHQIKVLSQEWNCLLKQNLTFFQWKMHQPQCPVNN